MALFIFACRIIAFTLLTLSAISLFRSSRPQRSVYLYALLVLCINGYLFTPYLFQWPGAEFYIPLAFGWGLLFDTLSSSTPAVFALFALSLFKEEQPLPRWLIVATLITLSLDIIGHSCENNHCGPFIQFAGYAWASFLVDRLPHLLRLLFIALTVYWTIDDWKQDLVETRRQFRVVFLITQMLVIIAILVSENFLPLSDQQDEQLLLINSLLIVLVSVVLIGYSMQYRPAVVDALFARFEEVSASADDNKITLKPDQAAVLEISPELQRLNELFDKQQVYRITGLTMGELAEKMRMPEYRLRQLINQQMNYRNFNALLNHYRIQDACGQLADPAKVRLPVLTIALDVGYRSLTPFNKAFKDAQSMTPTEYRKRHLAP